MFKNKSGGNLNLGMFQLISNERERLGIRLVGDEIWQDEFTVLPGYEGYAHFISDRVYALLVDCESFSLLSQAARKFYPTVEERQKLHESGFEIIAIIKLAAFSIGTASVYGKVGFSDLTDLCDSLGTDLFWQNVVQTWIFLGMVSDRLRSFFIQFVLRDSEKKLDKKLNAQNKKLQNPPSQFVYTQAF